MKKHTSTTVSISAWSVLRILLILLGLWFLWFIRAPLLMLFMALLLAALIDPAATWFQKKNLPRGLGVITVYAGLLAVITAVAFLIVPPFIGQFKQLSTVAGSLAIQLDAFVGFFSGVLSALEPYGVTGGITQATSGLQDAIAVGLSSSIQTLAGFFGGIATLILVLVMAFYIVIEEDAAKRLFRHITPKKHQAYIVGLVTRMQEKLGHWLRGQLLLMAIVGLLTYIMLLVMGVEYPLVLGVFAGFAELVPYAGPIIAAIPAIVITFIASPVKAVVVALLYFGIQQLENTVLTPKIMQKSVGLNPVISLMVLLIGFHSAELFGMPDFVGAILAIPVATVLSVGLRDVVDYYDQKHR